LHADLDNTTREIRVGIRTFYVAFVTVIVLLLGIPAAIAAPGTNGGPTLTDSKALGVDVHVQQGPSANGASHAAANGWRGMNRPGAPGWWKTHGHVPAAVSFPQGVSPSNPDADGNGGIDKPGHKGGFDADRDGNNGCGNDSDREDDNNGWCGKPRVSGPTPPGKPGPAPEKKPPAAKPTVVLGKKVPAQTLPTTGVDVSSVLWTGWGLVLAGTGMKRKARRRRR
jgi:hypothetical protein